VKRREGRRLRQADPDFALDGTSRLVAAELVARLDGMPLAIELAAARVEALGLGPLLDRLTHTFPLLVSTDPGAAARHRSLAATVEWSYRLLNQAEQEVFRRLSVFPGPFPLAGALAVAGPGAESAVLRLVDCSLLTPPQADPDGRLRYRLLETLRVFGRDQLAGHGEQDEADAALARYALEIAQQAADGRWAEAVTFEAARTTYRSRNNTTVRPLELRRGEELLRQAVHTLGEETARAAEERGAAMTLVTALELLLIVAEAESREPAAATAAPEHPRAPGTPDRTTGLDQLSRRERELVTLVAQGHTDAQIAGQLYISVSTVRSHLDRIRDKTSCRRRADLTRLALQAGLA
jgi:DNA-binding CsgD family transcriptional regulator